MGEDTEKPTPAPHAAEDLTSNTTDLVEASSPATKDSDNHPPAPYVAEDLATEAAHLGKPALSINLSAQSLATEKATIGFIPNELQACLPTMNQKVKRGHPTTLTANQSEQVRNFKREHPELKPTGKQTNNAIRKAFGFGEEVSDQVLDRIK
jgi:hypothetical protein